MDPAHGPDPDRDPGPVHVPAAGAVLEVATNATLVLKVALDPDHLLLGTVQDPGHAVRVGPARGQVNPKMTKEIRMAWDLAPDPGLEVPRITKPTTKTFIHKVFSTVQHISSSSSIFSFLGFIRFS